jgi:hypothetical protein
MPTQKLAVAVVHGVGSQKEDFAKAFAERLRATFAAEIEGQAPEPPKELQIRGVYWAKELADAERELGKRLEPSGLRWDEARNVMIDLGGDALAYQLNRQESPEDAPGAYERIHMAVAGTLRALVSDTDGEAPLCVIAHSLGTVIASNYLWDLQVDNIPPPVRAMFTGSSLESGKTLTSLYTMGSPIAIWSLRFPDFGTPITFPPAELLPRYGEPTEWVNLFDKDDVIAYPLKGLNDRYEANVTDDVAVNVGNVLTMWNPASHTSYWTDGDVVARVAEGLVRVWRQLNTPAG